MGCSSSAWSGAVQPSTTMHEAAQASLHFAAGHVLIP